MKALTKTIHSTNPKKRRIGAIRRGSIEVAVLTEGERRGTETREAVIFFESEKFCTLSRICGFITLREQTVALDSSVNLISSDLTLDSS
ncbi:14942_t:CDS:2 [Funneliformis caledonium]|uniref:14942_t:CDS:1 n=1 Tax=Funneliformis caledonium TaxID=1117310 RepID=A0A9N9BUH4_9GLOM|nr:14942_t:CDS:2 [Funneliformis caledonium]